MKTTVKHKIAAGITLGAMVLSIGAFAFANDPQGAPLAKPAYSDKANRPTPAQMEKSMKAKLAGLVSDGTISQQQSDQVLKFFKEKHKEMKADREKTKNMTPDERKAYFQEKFQGHPGMLSELKASANLSDDQAKAVADALRPHRSFADMQQKATEKLSGLVSAGTINQDQSNKILDFMKQKHEQMQAMKEQTKNMSPDERKAFFQEKFQNRPNMLNELKTAAGLSDDQAKAVTDALRPHHSFAERQQMANEKLSSLVSAGTISQNQSSKILDFMKQKHEQMQAMKEQTKDMTPDERKAFFQEKFQNHPNMLNELKTAAGLSDDQAKAVADALRPQHGPRPGAMGKPDQQ